MTLTVAYAPDERGKTALHLASMLARSIGDELVVCSVIPAPWVPGALQTMVGNEPALTNSSQCMCAYGGVITVTNPGCTKETVN